MTDFEYVFSWEDDGSERVELVETPSGVWKVNFILDSFSQSFQENEYPQMSIEQVKEMYYALKTILHEHKERVGVRK